MNVPLRRTAAVTEVSGTVIDTGGRVSVVSESDGVSRSRRRRSREGMHPQQTEPKASDKHERTQRAARHHGTC